MLARARRRVFELGQLARGARPPLVCFGYTLGMRRTLVRVSKRGTLIHLAALELASLSRARRAGFCAELSTPTDMELSRRERGRGQLNQAVAGNTRRSVGGCTSEQQCFISSALLLSLPLLDGSSHRVRQDLIPDTLLIKERCVTLARRGEIRVGPRVSESDLDERDSPKVWPSLQPS